LKASIQSKGDESEGMINVGIDIHKRRCQACLKDEKGRLIGEVSFARDHDGITSFHRLLQNHGEAKIVLESTGNLWVPIYDTLTDDPANRVILANPRKTRIIAEAKIKNDRMDARVLADLVRADLVAESYVPSKEIREQRALLRQRRSFVEDTVAIKNRIHSLLDRHNLQPQYSDLFGKHGREWLCSIELPSTEKTILDVELRQLGSLEAGIRTLTEKIAVEAAEEPRVRLLMGFTGIDYYSAMLLLAEIGDIKRFSSPKKLVAYAGLAPGMRSSAGKTVRGHITKEGNKYLRWILIEAAQHASRFDPKLQGFYQRVSARRGRQRAIVGVARKLLVSIYHVLYRNESYHGERPELLERKIRNLQRIVDSSLQEGRDNQTQDAEP
jgi:transposase